MSGKAARRSPDRRANDHRGALASDLAGWFRHEREAAIEACLSSPATSGDHLCAALTTATDELLNRMLSGCARLSGVDLDELPMAVVATGGYGRRELSPWSDIDVTFVTTRDGDRQVEAILTALFTVLMDTVNTHNRLEVGYAYRVVSDCATLDHQTRTGLFDMRHVAGSRRVFVQLQDEFWTCLNSTEFIIEKLAERRAALEDAAFIARHAEPDLKVGPGGLRDIHTAVWLMQARDDVSVGLGLPQHGLQCLRTILPEADYCRLESAREWLLGARNALHVEAGQARDTIARSRQDAVAALLGLGLNADSSFMPRLYQSLQTVRSISERVFRTVEGSRLFLGIGLDCLNGELVPATHMEPVTDADWLATALDVATRYGLRMSQPVLAEMERAVAAGVVTAQPPDTALCESLLSIAASRQEVYPILQQIAETGLLGAVIPEFGSAFDLPPPDAAHAYSVGQHSLQVVRELERLRTSVADDEPSSELSALLSEMGGLDRLRLAALLHDVGKAYPEEPHEEVGARIAADVCNRLGCGPDTVEAVVFLVRHHLVMSEASRLRDLGVPDTIADFARVVVDTDRLAMLYAFTMADMAAVAGLGAAPAQAGLLHELYWRTRAYLSEEPAGETPAVAADRMRRRLLRDMAIPNVPDDEVEEHIRSISPGFLFNLTPAELSLQLGYVREVRAGRPVVAFHDDRSGEQTEVTICAYDDQQPGLLSRIAGALTECAVNVHAAQVMTRTCDRDRIVMDSVRVEFRGRSLTGAKRRELTAAISRSIGLPDGGNRTHADSRKIDNAGVVHLSVVAIRRGLARELSAVDLTGGDLRSALYAGASVMKRLNCDIRSARLAVWRGEVRSCFYVTGLEALTDAEVVAGFGAA